METELTTWLDMVWEALSEEDKKTRGVQLKEAQTFLEKTQQSAPGVLVPTTQGAGAVR
jgi:hypothetical protein